MNREELLKLLRETSDQQARRQILVDAVNAGQVGEADLAELQSALEAEGLEDAADIVQGVIPQARAKGTVAQWESRVERGAEDQEARQDSVVEQREADQAQSAFDAAEADGVITAEEVAAAEQAGFDLTGGDRSPRWILDQNGTFLTDDQKDRLVGYVNFYQGGQFNSYDELVASGYLDDPTAINQQTVQSALLDEEPFQTLSVSLPGRDLFTVRASEWESAQQMYGVDSRDLTKIVRVTNQVGAVDSTGQPAWQLMSALMKATGMLDTVLNHRPGGPGIPSAIYKIGRIQGDPASKLGGVPVMRDPAPDPIGLPITDEKPLGFDEAGVPTSRFAAGPKTAAEMSYAINEGMRLYDDSLAMSYIHVLDPQLAAKIKMGARNPGMVTRKDLNKLFDLVSLSGAPTTEDFRTQLILQGEARLQGDTNDMVSGYLDMLLGNDQDSDDGSGRGGSAGSEVIRQKPDPASLDERLRDLYQTMFFEEPDEATLSKFRSQINAAIDGAAPGDTVDWGARASQFARQDPRYADLYGAKPDTVSEDDYRYQFEAGQADMLGADRAGNAAAMAGMRDGTYQTTVGAAAGTKEAWDNSTFLGRLARAAQAVGEMT